MADLSPQLIMVFAFGVAFVIALLVLAIKYPTPTSFQQTVFRTVLALAAAGVAALLPGLFHVEISAAANLMLRAGGALGVFAVVYFFNPARLLANTQMSDVPASPPMPSQLRDGTTTPDDLKPVLFEVWKALADLSTAGRDLWAEVSPDNVSAFSKALRTAHSRISDNALFFSEGDYQALLEALDAANFYIGGKESLLRLRGTLSQRSPQRREEIQERVAQRIAENKLWLARYGALLRQIHGRMRQGLDKVSAA